MRDEGWLLKAAAFFERNSAHEMGGWNRRVFRVVLMLAGSNLRVPLQPKKKKIGSSSLTSGIFSSRAILDVYRMSADLPEVRHKRQDWHLDFSSLDTATKNDRVLIYPHKFEMCD